MKITYRELCGYKGKYQLCLNNTACILVLLLLISFCVCVCSYSWRCTYSVHLKGDQNSTLGVDLQLSPTLAFIYLFVLGQGFSLVWSLLIRLGWLASMSQWFCCLWFLSYGVKVHAAMPYGFVHVLRLKSGPYTCMVNMLWTELSF